NARVLMRAVASALRTGVAAGGGLVASLATLAAAADALAEELAGAGDEPRSRRLAVDAADAATAVLVEQSDLRTTMIVGQVRATAVDLLRASGLTAEQARAALAPVPSADMYQ
ncbi:MAG TPA: hypothetical protein VL977_08765, partial [Solirubrobacteraceae bacterium]|nr:hypothetical protein [Solirubrobacteraceae bacterium]